MNWNDYYLEQAGYGFSPNNVFRGSLFQKGFGIGGMFRRFFRWIVPVLKEHALPAVASGAKEIGRTALDSAANIAKDVVAGKDLTEAAKEHATTAIDNLKTKAEKALSGKGIKRSKKNKRYVYKKQKQEKDIFN